MCETRAVPSRAKPDSEAAPRRHVGLKQVAEYVGLSTATVSFVLNGSAGANAIPETTKKRIFEAARKLNYRPNFVARSLKSQRTYAVGVLVPEFSDGYSAIVLNGIEERLRQDGYLCLVTSHRRAKESLERYPRMLFERRVEGLITVDTPYTQHLPIPVVSVSGHDRVEGVTYVVLNHEMAAELALQHLKGLGHKNIAFIRGQSFTADAESRWNAIRSMARRLDLHIDPALVAQLDENSPSPEVGYRAAVKILKSSRQFTALFAFNDVSAIGAIRALHEAGLEVPGDVSVVGFDDVTGAAFHTPPLTTIRQPLARMGMLAAELLMKQIVGDPGLSAAQTVQVDPEIVIRESTAKVRSQVRKQPSSRRVQA